MALKQALRQLNSKTSQQPLLPRPRPAVPEGRVDPGPACAFGLVLAERVNQGERALERIEAKINGLIFAVVLTALVEIGRAVLN